MDTKQVDWLSKTVFEIYSANAGIFTAPENDDSYGIEIEMEGVDDDGILNFADNAKKNKSWRVVADGSLRNGVEFVSAGPRGFDLLGDDLDTLTAYLESKKFTPVFSYRTSVHVHCNVQNLSMTEVMALFTLYTIFEAPMIQVGGEERCGNVHCLPVSMAQNVLDRARTVCYNVDPNEPQIGGRQYWHNAFRTLTSNDQRYASFNWASMPNYGTIEFRSHRGTADKTEILNWVNIIHSLKQAAVTLGNPTAVVNNLSQLGVQQFTDKVFGEHAPAFTEFCQDYEQAIWEGVRLAQFVGYSRTEWPAKKPFKPKKVKGQEAQVIIDDPQPQQGIRLNNLAVGQIWNEVRPGDWDVAGQALRQNAADDFDRVRQMEQQLFNRAVLQQPAAPNRAAAARRRQPVLRDFPPQDLIN